MSALIEIKDMYKIYNPGKIFHVTYVLDFILLKNDLYFKRITYCTTQNDVWVNLWQIDENKRTNSHCFSFIFFFLI